VKVRENWGRFKYPSSIEGSEEEEVWRHISERICLSESTQNSEDGAMRMGYPLQERRKRRKLGGEFGGGMAICKLTNLSE
jgi:hypothetical protein